MKEEQLVVQCKQKKTAAQKVLYERYYYSMYRLAIRYLANHHDVEDVLINAFTRILNRIDRFSYRGEGSLIKWIRTIVINESIRHINTKKALQYEEDITYMMDKTFDSTEIDSIDIERLYQIIENMPSGYRIVFNMFAIDGYSHAEVAEELNISVNTSKTQLRKARQHIISRIQNKQS